MCTRQNSMTSQTPNIFSRITFWWMNELFSLGNKSDLQERDFDDLHKKHSSLQTCERLEKNWNLQLKASLTSGKKPDLIRAVINAYWLQWLLFAVLAVVKEALGILTPFLIGRLLQYFSGQIPLADAYWYSAGITAIAIAFTFLHQWFFYLGDMMGWHVRAATCALMYKKTLRLNQLSLSSTTTGQIVNLGATDVLRFDILPPFIHYIWLSPILVAIVTYLLWQELGITALVSVGIIFLPLLSQILVGPCFGKIRAQTALQTDKRIQTMNELLVAMRIVKLYAWEKRFADLVSNIRKKEINWILKSSYLKAYNSGMTYASGKILVFATFVTYVVLGGELTAPKVFTVMAWFNSIRLPTTVFAHFAIEKIAESRISLKRIENFLLLEELKPDVEGGVQTEFEKPLIKLENYFGSWNANKSTSDTGDQAPENVNCLKNVSVTVRDRNLLAIVGPVGCGKSSFLCSILRELPRKAGKLVVQGNVAYVGQVPWIFSGTVKQNILFGEAFDAQRYNEVIKVCALQTDISNLPHGDETLVGERGAALSGGQKARVNLARAAYRENIDIMLLDDPLSAVDANVANHIFHECICGYMKNKIRVLVTHQFQFLQSVDEILILKAGEVVAYGSFQDIQTSGADLAYLTATNSDDQSENQHVEHPLRLYVPQFQEKQSSEKTNDEIYGTKVVLQKNVEHVADVENEEIKAQGSIGLKSYVQYLASRWFRFALVVVLIIANHTLHVATDWWISVWATNSQDSLASLNTSTSSIFANRTMAVLNPQPISSDDFYYIRIYAILVASFLVALFGRTLLHYHHTVASGRRMHDKMLTALLHAPIRFFDVNPVGRILNRFSKDMGQVDEILPWLLLEFTMAFFLVLSIIIVGSVINYFVLIAVFPLLIYFLWLRRYYIKTSRDIKRIEGANRSPVFSHLAATIHGLTTVRAFKMQEKFEVEFHRLQDKHSVPWFLFLSGTRWFSLRLDIISATFIGVVAFLSVATTSWFETDAGRVGLALIYALQLMGYFQWCVRMSTEVENQMTSVERIQQYHKIPPEASHNTGTSKLPVDWPVAGDLLIQNASFAHYESGPTILCDISLHIKPMEKIGVVGRTGAGKSSLIASLFRLTELRSGKIFLDNVDISTIGLTKLRSSISVITQDPILFAGTLRKNLDPFSMYTDTELWTALEKVEMKETVAVLPVKLETKLAESGSNFSVGQRQLLCLARAILTRNKILAIDEATANVDMRTDKLIQKTIRKTFKDCTVITVAHRINTIIDSDRVLVLDQGRLVEFDAPSKLLNNRDSAFSGMVDSLGSVESDNLRRLANDL